MDKDISSPDRLEKMVIGFSEFFRTYKTFCKGTLIFILSLCVLALGLWGWFSFRNSQIRDDLARIDHVFHDEEISFGKNQKKLKDEVSQLYQDLQKNPSVKKIIEEKEEKIQEMRPDHSESQKAYEDFAKRHNNKFGWRAALLAAQIQTEKENYHEALDLLTMLLERAGHYPFYRDYVRLYAARLWEEVGQYDKSLQICEDFEKQPKNEALNSSFLALKGQALISMNEKEKALQVWQELIQTYPASKEARRILSWMALKGLSL